MAGPSRPPLELYDRWNVRTLKVEVLPLTARPLREKLFLCSFPKGASEFFFFFKLRKFKVTSQVAKKVKTT